MRYWCERCKQESNTLDPPHLCKDIAARLRKREKQASAVEEIIGPYFSDPVECREKAELIVKKLSHMGVEDD